MERSVTRPRIFIGSSAEGKPVARNLHAELDANTSVDVVRWDQSVFAPGGYALDSLIAVAADVDFAVLVATPDDATSSRGQTAAAPRDNIVLEFGLFVGVLGRERTYLLATDTLKLPTDVLGTTRLTYQPRADGDLRAAVSSAALQIEERMASLGLLDRPVKMTVVASRDAALVSEIGRLCANAVAQGWTVRRNDATTLRLRAPNGRQYTLSKSRPDLTREELRSFAAQLRSGGLRVNSSVRRPVAESPF